MIPTLETIAAELNVSKATVSLALRNDPRISQRTRDRVNLTAERLGYRPNPMISSLMTNLRRKRSGGHRATLCFLTSFPSQDGWRRFPTFVQFFEGICKRADELGYHIETHWLKHGSGSGAALTRVLEARGIPGLILAPLPDRSVQPDLDWSRFAMVAFGHSFALFPVHRVSNNHFLSVNEALRQCYLHGYRRPGLVIPQVDAEKSDNFSVAAYYSFAVTHPDVEKLPPLVPVDYNAQSIQRWIERERPDVVLSTGERVWQWICEMGIHVPDEVGFVHLDWAEEKGDFAGIDQESEKIGAVALDILAGQIQNNERGPPEVPKTILINGVWRSGPTIRQWEKP